MSDEPLAALAFGPHPDDVELCCGGLLASLAVRGHRVGVVDLTRGELGSNGTVEGRARECEEATRVLGLSCRENLALPDGGLDPSPAAGHVRRVAEAIRRLRPELVLAPHAHARHPDHVAASAIVEAAVFQAGVRLYETEPQRERHVVRQLAFYMMRGAFDPSFVVDVSDVHERKMEALACYSSQLSRADGDEEGVVPTLANAPLNLAALEARDRVHGAMIGVRHGEAFLVRGAIGMRDPVEHFRNEPCGALLHGPRR